MSWSDLEAMVDEIHRTHNPALRIAVRSALDRGASPAEISKRWGLDGKRVSLTAYAVESFIAEWLREVDAIAADRSAIRPMPSACVSGRRIAWG